jgi:protoporphyrinogen oxidase
MVANSDKRVGIIGGGIGGMSAAWELSRHGIHVDLFERDTTLGGLAGWFDVNGSTLEKFYHHLYNLDRDLIQLIQDVGLGNNLVFRRTNTGAFYVNKIYRLSKPLDLIKYKPLPFADRLRMGFLVIKARKIKNWKELDTVTARDWIIRNSSQAVFDIVWSPLFRSKFGKYADEVSAAWLWSKLVQRGGSRSKGGAEELGYLKGGYGLLFDTMEEKLAERNVHIHKASPVDAIVNENGMVTGLKVHGDTIPFTHVIACVQLPDFLQLTTDAPETYRNELRQIGFLGNVTLVMRMNRRLSDTYWVNITDPECPFVGVIEQTNLLDESHYGGTHLAYISRYMDTDDPLYRMDKDHLFAVYAPWLRKVFPEFSQDWIEDLMVWREPHSQAVVSIGYGEKIPAIRTPLKRLYLSTMAQIFPEDRQMSNGVKFAKKATELVLSD